MSSMSWFEKNKKMKATTFFKTIACIVFFSVFGQAQIMLTGLLPELLENANDVMLNEDRQITFQGDGDVKLVRTIQVLILNDES